jgi:putative FmdB family regulatory protein
MPTYPYQCLECAKFHDVIKPMSECAKVEHCPTCKSEMERIFTPLHFIGTSVENAEYNPGLGKVTKSKKHRAELAKQMGVHEIGNDYKSPEDIGKKFDQDREKKLEKSWEDV